MIRVQDPDAIAQLYDSYGPAVYGIVMRIVENRELQNKSCRIPF